MTRVGWTHGNNYNVCLCFTIVLFFSNLLFCDHLFSDSPCYWRICPNGVQILIGRGWQQPASTKWCDGRGKFDFAPKAEHFLQEQCAPLTLFKGFAHRFRPLYTLQSDHRQFRWSSVSERTTPDLLAFYALLHALMHAPTTMAEGTSNPKPSWQQSARANAAAEPEWVFFFF